jgi:hypothetical protein
MTLHDLTQKERTFLLNMIEREIRRAKRGEARSLAEGFVATQKHRNANTSRIAHLTAVKAKVEAIFAQVPPC